MTLESSVNETPPRSIDENDISPVKSPQASPHDCLKLPDGDTTSVTIPIVTPPPPKPYTTFTTTQKRLLTLLLGLATITSPLTATIYFPLLPLLRSHFHSSSQAINLTITLYIIFQALSLAIFGPLSDSLGRRPVYLITITLYVVGILGLALNRKSYTVLLVLRALQSLGASAAYAVSFGVVADVCVPSDRGRMLGPVSMALKSWRLRGTGHRRMGCIHEWEL